jgi:hypothetical protein
MGAFCGIEVFVSVLDAVACRFDTLKRQSHQTFNEIVLIMTLSIGAP